MDTPVYHTYLYFVTQNKKSITYVLEQNHILVLSLQFSDQFVITDNSKHLVIDQTSNIQECLGFLSLLINKVTKSNDIVGSNQLLSLFSRGYFNSRRTSLLLEPVDNVVSLATTY